MEANSGVNGMNQVSRKWMEYVQMRAQNDPVYQQMFLEYRKLERRFMQIEKEIPVQYRDVLWDYFGLCDDMTLRLAEIACICLAEQVGHGPN